MSSMQSVLESWRKDNKDIRQSLIGVPLLEQMAERELCLISILEILLEFQYDWKLKPAHLEVIKEELDCSPEPTDIKGEK